jgi:alpha-beta hydrolase superfamily lysophospholipase
MGSLRRPWPKASAVRARRTQGLPRVVIALAAVTVSALALAACATPYVQPPLVPPAGFAGPAIVEPARPGSPGAFVVQDGGRLPFLRWSPKDGEPDVVIIALHGMNDHNASFRLAGPWWAEHGIETWSFDQRGFGQAPGRGKWAGEAAMVQDLRTVVDLVRARRPGARIAVVGESMGGSLAAAAFASDNPPKADRLVLLAPGVWGWSSQSLFNRASLWFAARALGSLAVEPPDFIARRIVASSNLLELYRNGRDPDAILATRFDTISGLVSLMESASQSLGRTKAPTLLLYGAHDQVVEPGPMRRALTRAGAAPNLTTGYYPNGWHLLNRDLDAEVMYRDVAAWLRDDTAPLPSGADPVLPQLERAKP